MHFTNYKLSADCNATAIDKLIMHYYTRLTSLPANDSSEQHIL